MLYIIPVPLGNMKDTTLRAIDMFKELDFLICEDTRSTKKLMQLLAIDYKTKQFYSLTSFTGVGKMDQYIELIKNNNVWLVSDAGTPWLSDPGKSIIQLCHENNFNFTVLPWANALIPAVVASGFDTSQFVFLGFLPKKKGKKTLLMEMVGEVWQSDKTMKRWNDKIGKWIVWSTEIPASAGMTHMGQLIPDFFQLHGNGKAGITNYKWQIPPNPPLSKGANRAYFFYESVHRIDKILQELYDMWFRGKISIAREISKMHEQLITDDIEKVIDYIKSGKIVKKGEFVVGLYSY